MSTQDAATDPFAAEVAANAAYAEQFALAGLPAKAARGLAVVTCMDTRIDPLAVLGLQPGDAKIIRNPGGRVTPEALSALVLTVHLLGVTRVLVVPHTRCKMAVQQEADIHAAIEQASGVDTRSLELRPSGDVRATLGLDVQRVRSSPYLPADLVVGGAVYDVDTGLLDRVL